MLQNQNNLEKYKMQHYFLHSSLSDTLQRNGKEIATQYNHIVDRHCHIPFHKIQKDGQNATDLSRFVKFHVFLLLLHLNESKCI